ncbi:hypothetical protein FOZ61_004945 [Perkinsus olseni]|uniref:t-SNARE coiled-coil homology domain-containing protein n=1 Tax=Perkinsus olseni TaxID=32597 RepID=A0A7J6MC25_PEROL|nr:hypothetical protein FOZ61_004945 [Perkinsus olseni]
MASQEEASGVGAVLAGDGYDEDFEEGGEAGVEEAKTLSQDPLPAPDGPDASHDLVDSDKGPTADQPTEEPESGTAGAVTEEGEKVITLTEEAQSWMNLRDAVLEAEGSVDGLLTAASLEDLREVLAWSVREGRAEVVRAVLGKRRISPDSNDPSGLPWLVSALQQRPSDRALVEALLDAGAVGTVGADKAFHDRYIVNSGNGSSVSPDIQALLGVVSDAEASTFAEGPPAAAATAPATPAMSTAFRQTSSDHLRTATSSPVISRSSPHNMMMSTTSTCRSQRFQGDGAYMVSLSNFSTAPNLSKLSMTISYSRPLNNPGPGAYNPPLIYSNPKLKGAPRYGFGSSRRFNQRRNDMPGPDKYRPRDPVLAASLSYGFGTSTRPPIGGPGSSTAALRPGPGAYKTPQNPGGCGPRYTLRARTKKDTLGVSAEIMRNPGPGTYSPASLLKEHHGYSFAHSSASSIGKRAFKVPGPGSYSMRNVKGTGTSSPAFSMSSRPAGWNVPNQWSSRVPGPGSYKSLRFYCPMKGSKESGSSSHLGRHPPPSSRYECAVDDPLHEESHGLLAQELEHRESGDSHAFVDERVVHERHAGISRIHEQVQQVSDMFRDLAVMVSDQGQQISSVENTVETTVSDSKGGPPTKQPLAAQCTFQRLSASWRKPLGWDTASAIGHGVSSVLCRVTCPTRMDLFV